jgi:Carboxypeptidase regulatory-like domain
LWKALARTSTDATGRFALEAEFDAGRLPGWTVIVRAKDAGIASRFFFGDIGKEGADQDKRLTFRLRKAVTIEGRLLTPEGAPANGVGILLESVMDGEDWFESTGAECPSFGEDTARLRDFWPGPWTTDNKGRFRIEGVVPEGMAARLVLHHPEFADDQLVVSAGMPHEKWAHTFRGKPVDARFTHTLAPARPITGLVTDKESGKPLARVLIFAYGEDDDSRAYATTDASGRYRAAVGGGGSYYVTAYPEPASGRLPLVKPEIPWPAGARELSVDLALPGGRIVRGTVVEGKQGKPIAGASVVYRPAADNLPDDDDEYDFNNPVLTDQNGKFALTVLPGQGLLGVEAPTGDFIRVEVTGLRLDGRSANARPHGFASIDAPADQNKAPADTRITLRRGVKLTARFVGPDGSPIDTVLGWCSEWLATGLDNAPSPSPIPGGLFELEGADPQRSYRAFFLDPKHSLGAVAELKYDPSGPALVRLKPTATAKGTVVDEQGLLLKNTQIMPWIGLTRDVQELTVEDLGDQSRGMSYASWTREPNPRVSPAEFCFDKLIPGVPYYVNAGFSFHAIGVLQPAEVRDLGKIVVNDKNN